MRFFRILGNFLSIMVLLVGLVIIAFFAFYFYNLNAKNNFLNQPKPVEAEILTPAKLISESVKYHNQIITVRGVTDQEAVVCEKKECPAEDTCCGCPESKNLILLEPQMTLENKLQSRLPLLDAKLEPLCRRGINSCQYVCSDWVRGALYDVTGIFHGEKQLGLSVVVNLNLQAQSKEIVKNLNFFDSMANFFEGLKQAVTQFNTSGTFVNR